jgi:hypothetical protein
MSFGKLYTYPVCIASFFYRRNCRSDCSDIDGSRVCGYVVKMFSQLLLTLNS